MDIGIISVMLMKILRNGIVYAFTILFASIAMMGEGLHTLPGVGHSCGQSSDCVRSVPTECDGHDCHSDRYPAFTHSVHSSDGTNSATDCAVCKYISLAKTCRLAAHLVGDCFHLSELLPIYCCIVECQMVGSYQSRAPPFDLSQV
jgi:hypothetical protein